MQLNFVSKTTYFYLAKEKNRALANQHCNITMKYIFTTSYRKALNNQFDF